MLQSQPRTTYRERGAQTTRGSPGGAEASTDA